MGKFDYNEAHDDAVELITCFGAAGQAVKKGSDGGYDYSGNVIPAEPDTVISGTVSPLLKYKQFEVDGESVLSTDSYVFFDSVTPPEIGMMIEIGNEQFRIVDVIKLDSVDSVNIYRKLQLRK